MPLWMLAPLVVFGVSLVVALVHVSGGTRHASFRDEAAAKAAAADAFPGMKLGPALLSAGRDAAFLDAGDRIVALLPLGNRHVVRLLAREEVKPVAEGETAIRFPAMDAATPAMVIRFDDRAKAAQLLRWFGDPAHA
jgi:hypothetical protein